ncbi:MAG: hypothetical protein OQK25_04075 [Gammaproteobacteria bacterium]|nr:hypothetical protein [Gammaproteobacteria bacterium]
MSERARFHARRKNIQVTESMSHKALYPLIDIMVDATNNSLGCRSCTTFSGYTLADHDWLSQWEEADRHDFEKWLGEESQVRTIEKARSRLLVDPRTIKEEMHPYPQQLYSLLKLRLMELPMRRATVEQWRRTLLNMKRDGIRREELDWSGVNQFLFNQDDSAYLTKDELLAAIDFSHIELQLCNELECDVECHLPFNEIAQRIPGTQLQISGYPVNDEDVGVVRYRSSSPSYRVGSIRTGGRALLSNEQPRWFVLGPFGNIITTEKREAYFFDSSDAARRAAIQHARKSNRLQPELIYSQPYEYMTLHGGDDYREWLVTLPNYHRSHFTAHYYERNVLLHIRTKIRKSVEGYRVLFIEELQSDWQQAVAQNGLSSGIPLAPFRKEWASLALKLMLMHVAKTGLDGIAWTNSKVHEMRYERSMNPLERLYDQQIPQTLNNIGRTWKTEVQTGEFNSRSPWLHAARCDECWKVEGGAGKFSTRPRYNKQQAQELIVRHSKELTLSLPMMLLPDAMKREINVNGLPLFGEQLHVKL